MSKIAGEFIMHGDKYFISLEENKGKRTWFIASEIHQEDAAVKLFGGEMKHPLLTRITAFGKSVPQGYLLGSIVQSKTTNSLSVYGSSVLITEALELIQKAQTYGYDKNSIHQESLTSANGVLHKVKIADDGYLKSHIEKKNNEFSYINITYQGMYLTLQEGYSIRPGFKVERKTMEDLVKDRKKRDLLSTAHALDFESLDEILDLSWYHNNGRVLVDYGAIQSKREVEEQFIIPFMEYLLERKAKGLKTVLSVDTETTGLNFYQLSPDNPLLDHIVAIPIGWKLNQGRIIFIDMEYFKNVDLAYVLARMAPLMVGRYGKRTLDKIEITLDENGEEVATVVGQWEFDREDIILTGHNAPFDGRVFYHYKVETFWNDDTLQMFFNLNPRIAKGAGSLKNLTEKLRGRQSPELSDILGRGNEGNFRLITDIRVAIVYGCADGDNTTFLQELGQRLMGPKMYRAYQKQDIPVLNRLFISEYIGIPIDEDAFRKEATAAKNNMKLMEDLIFHHVGSEIEIQNAKNSLKQKHKAGLLTNEQYIREMKKVPEVFPDAYQEFKLRGDDLRTALFGILKYPSKFKTAPTRKYPQGQPSVDKAAIEHMLKAEYDTPRTIWKEDLKSETGETLLKAETLNKKQNPMAYVLAEYKKLDKDWTSYYEPILTNNLEGRMFKSYSMARIETRRIMNPAQTMKAKMKNYVVSLGPDWYVADFDQAQAEPRIMVSLSGDLETITKFNNPEKDYHTETAAAIRKILPHELSKYIRKIYKEITLGLPYGIGPKKMCGKIHDGVVNDDTLFQTNVDIDRWKTTNDKMWEMLKGFQRKPLTPVKFSEEMVDFLWKTTRTEEKPEPRMWGAATNIFGFHRLFDITDIVPGNSSQEGMVMRPAGNYPIQSLAAEIFRNLLINLYDRCVAEGIEDKIVWHMLIHDELLMSVHKSVHPFFLYKILYESCTVTLPGHTTYYIGINIGNSWGECKKDETEAPVLFVDRIVARWDAGEFRDDDYQSDVKAYVAKHMKEYFDTRIGECLRKIQPNIDTHPVNLKDILPKFDNYTVRAYVPVHYKPNRPVQKDNNDDYYDACFESWMIDVFGEGKELICRDGTRKIVMKGSAKEEKNETAVEMEFPEDSAEGRFEPSAEDEYYSFEDSEMDELEYRTYVYEEEESYEEKMLRRHKEALMSPDKVIHNKLKDTPTFKNLKLRDDYLVIKVPRFIHVDLVKQQLADKRSQEGYTVIIEHSMGRVDWVPISKDTDLATLDEFVGGLK